MKSLFHSLGEFFSRFTSSSQQEDSEPEEVNLNPDSAQEAHARLHHLMHPDGPLQEVSHQEFILGWNAISYIAPSLNPDEAADKDGGWSKAWLPIAEEAFRRFKANTLTKEELYPRPGDGRDRGPTLRYR